MLTVPASDYNHNLYKLPTFAALSSLGHSELHALAYRIAQLHQRHIAQLNPVDLAAYVTEEHQYGVHFLANKKLSLDGISGRLQDAAFWRRVITKNADTSRERQEVLAGKVGSHGQKYCSDLTLRRLEEREELANRNFQMRSKAQHGVPVMSLNEVNDARNNKKYLLALALLEISKSRAFKAFFLTITCPERPRSFKSHNDIPSSAGAYDSAYKFLEEFFGSLNSYLREKFELHVDFFGFRATEVHEDGCPHYHIILFCKPAMEPFLRKKLAKLFNNDPLRPAGYFKKFEHEIIKELDTENHNERKAINYSLKLLFDDNQSTPEIQHERNEKRRRSKCAIKVSRKRRVQFFGVEGLQQKMDMAKKAVRDATADEKLKEIGRKLLVDRHDPQHNQIRLAAVVSFIQDDAPRLEFTWSNRVNKYGEATKTVTGIRLSPVNLAPRLLGTTQLSINTLINGISGTRRSSSSARNIFHAGRCKPRNLRVTHNTSRYRGSSISKRRLQSPSAYALIYSRLRSRSGSSPVTHRRSRAPPM